MTDMNVELVDHMGSDLSVVNAARVSFDKTSKWVYCEGSDGRDKGLSGADKKLISYLAKHNHWTPFAHTSVSLRIKAPIFVARQLGKHQIGLVWNEVSRRYVDAEPEFYVPDVWRKRAENVKQGSSDEPVDLVFVKGVCGNCGKHFAQSGNSQKFCSVNCQATSYRKAHPKETKWIRWKSSAKHRGLEFSIGEEDVEWVSRCPYLGIEIDYQSNDAADNTASLDRIDSSKGYVAGNVQIISHKANKLKNDATSQEMITFAKNALLIHGGIIVDEFSGVKGLYQKSLDVYNSMLKQGVAPEMARMVLPQAVMTEWIWTGSLAAFVRVCKLRLDPHTQAETREVAAKMAEIIEPLYPVSWKELMNNG